MRGIVCTLLLFSRWQEPNDLFQRGEYPAQQLQDLSQSRWRREASHRAGYQEGKSLSSHLLFSRFDSSMQRCFDCRLTHETKDNHRTYFFRVLAVLVLLVSYWWSLGWWRGKESPPLVERVLWQTTLSADAT